MHARVYMIVLCQEGSVLKPDFINSLALEYLLTNIGCDNSSLLISRREYIFYKLHWHKTPWLIVSFLFKKVASRHQKGGKDSKMDFLVMENLLFGRNLSRLYDLKGSSRSRYNSDTTGSNKVLLDQNLIEAMPTSPIFVGNKAKRVLERAVWNDTAFLAVSFGSIIFLHYH